MFLFFLGGGDPFGNTLVSHAIRKDTYSSEIMKIARRQKIARTRFHQLQTKLSYDQHK